MAGFATWQRTVAAQTADFTIEQALSAPFTENLRAAPAKGRLAWVANIGGRRNLWVAEPAAGGKGYGSRQITHYTEDDGHGLPMPSGSYTSAATARRERRIRCRIQRGSPKARRSSCGS
jgi:hypothetical protein